MATLQSPRGTRDILPEQQAYWSHVKHVGARIATEMGFDPITTPTYEYRELFERSIGKGTDVMDKELFLLRSRGTEAGQEEYALRPEGTAGIVRAFIEHGMHLRPQPVKLWSFLNNFRYDRPQKGRYREHVQFDLELFGDTGPFADAWIILATYRFLSELGLQGLKLQLNTLGTMEERQKYQDALREQLMNRKHELSEDSQNRLDVNPLRILDSKDQQDQRVLDGLPALLDFCSDETKAHYQAVRDYLQTWGIPYVENARLVRGLDYYCHTAFEWTTEGAGGQQSSLGGGGRYDGLLTQLGGQGNGAVGAGIGLDRVIEEMERQEVVLPQNQTAETVAVAVAEPDAKQKAASLVQRFLSEGKRVVANFDRDSLGSQLKTASKQGATRAYILGSEELANNTVTIKNLEDGSQTTEAF